MTRAARRGGLLAVALLLIALPAAAQARTLRIFAAGPRFELGWVDTRAHFHDKLLALLDRSKRGGSVPRIQRAADDVASHLRPTPKGHGALSSPNLVVLPEDVGLMTAFTGTRAATARKATGLVGAIAGLLGPYAPLIAYYDQRFPSLATRALPVRTLAISLTDTFARTAVETYADLARRYHVYLEAGVNMTESWQIVCTSKAGFQAPPGAPAGGCAVQDAAKVAKLRDPDEPARDYAYEATSPRAANMALVFDPLGHLISKQVKTYLTPTELPGQLDLVPGDVSGGLSVVHTPVANLGIVTSKDAWMPDVLDKLDEARADVLVQPEFFIGDTVGAPGMWSPDNLKASGFSDLIRHPSFQAEALASMTGNLFDFSADAQQHIAVVPRRRTGTPRGALVGQPLAAGFATVGRWVLPDPASLPFPARRAKLAAAGAKLLPGSGVACADPAVAGPCEGGQVEDVIHRDITLTTPRHRPVRRVKHGTTPFSVNRPLAPSVSEQRNVVLAARGRTVVAAWEEHRGGTDRLGVARSGDGGRSWSRARYPFAGGVRWPSVAIASDGRVWFAWSAHARLRSGHQGVGVHWAVASSKLRFGPQRRVEPSPVADQWKPQVAATGKGRAVLAWVDERLRSADDGLPQAHVFTARITPAALRGTPTRIDTGAPVTNAARLDNSWSPSIAAHGSEVLLSWLDFRTYDWRVSVRRSHDAGASFGAERAVTDTPAGQEALDDTPRSLLLRGDHELVAFTAYGKRGTHGAPHPLYDIDAAVPGRTNRQVDTHGSAQVSTFSPSAVALPSSGALVAWQDDALPPGEIVVARVDASGRRRGSAVRVDDAGTRGRGAWRPAVTVAGGRAVIAWEDARDGPRQVFVATAPISLR